MIKHIWSILCEKVVTDKDTGVTSYLSAIEAIIVKSVPVTMPFLALGSLWRTDNPAGDNLQFRVSLIHPESKWEKQLVTSEGTLLVTKRYRSNVVMNGSEFVQAGTYMFKVEVCNNGKWEQVAEIPFDVTVATEK